MLLDDAELLRQFVQNRSEKAFTALVRRHVGLVYSSALRRVGGDTHWAEDVSQQVFIALAQRAAGLICHVTLPGWLYTTTRNLALAASRAERRRTQREQAAFSEGMPMSQMTGGPDWRTLGPKLDEAIDSLDEEDRIAVLERFFRSRTFTQIGAALGLREDAARMRVNRALERLRARLEERGIVSTSTALMMLLATEAVAAVPDAVFGSVNNAVWAAVPRAGFKTGLSVAAKSGLVIAAALTLGLLGSLIAHRRAGHESSVDSGLTRSEIGRPTAAQIVVTKGPRRAEPTTTPEQGATPIPATAGSRAVAESGEPLGKKNAELPEVSLQGQVRNPGRFRIATLMTVGQVVAKAGGLTDLAKRSGLIVTRFISGRKQTIIVDFDGTVEGSDGRRTSTLILFPRDIIYVPSTEDLGTNPIERHE